MRKVYVCLSCYIYILFKGIYYVRCIITFEMVKLYYRKQGNLDTVIPV